MLTRIYGADRIEDHNYGTIVRSLTFAGTIVGMIIFGVACPISSDRTILTHSVIGWLSDKVGRKFGMVRGMDSCQGLSVLLMHERLDVRNRHRRIILWSLSCILWSPWQPRWNVGNAECNAVCLPPTYNAPPNTPSLTIMK